MCPSVLELSRPRTTGPLVSWVRCKLPPWRLSVAGGLVPISNCPPSDEVSASGRPSHQHR